MPPNTVNVTRPGKYGNPYYPGCGIGYGYFNDKMEPVNYDVHDPAQCVLMFKFKLRDMEGYRPEEFKAYIEPLRGKNLACWCKIGAPCHGDLLLKLANR